MTLHRPMKIISKKSSMYHRKKRRRVLRGLDSELLRRDVYGVVDEDRKLDGDDKKNGWWVRVGEAGEDGLPKNRRSMSSAVYRVVVDGAEVLDDGADEGSKAEEDVPEKDVPEEEAPEEEAPEEETPEKETPEEEAQPPTDDVNTTIAEDPPPENSSERENEPISIPNDQPELLPEDETGSGNDPPHPENLHLPLRRLSPSQEHMLISGGFTDTDWQSFPLWSFNLTAAHDTGTGNWVPLTFEDQIAGRVGHLSAVWDGYLYVFGGLLYRENLFHVEEEIVLHRAKIGPFLNDTKETLKWEDVTPTIQGTDEYLPRGEAQGGIYENGNESMLVIHGGLHVRHTPSSTHHSNTIQVDVPQGDVWGYFFHNNTLLQLSSATEEGPTPRTAHAGTILGRELVIYGGMSLNLDSWSGLQWDMLSDVWAFDLVERTWREVQVYPQLMRSYHSLVSTPDDQVVAFGGFRTAETVAGEPIAFVFSDTLITDISPKDDFHTSTWQKAEWPAGGGDGVSHRLEHTSVLDQFSNLYIWGGRFKTVSQIEGLWRLNVGKDSEVNWIEAQPDGLDAYEAELQTLHLLVAVMLFMSVLFTALYGTLRRQAEETNGTTGGGGGLLRRGRGLSQSVINSLPVKTFNRDENENDEECCPICLVDYETGEEMRSLSCGHEFHKHCVDSWLGNNASCPACRASVSADDGNPNSQPEDQESRVVMGGGMSRLFPTVMVLNSRRRWFGPVGMQNENNLEISESSSSEERRDDRLELPYVSDLELTEEIEPQQQQQQDEEQVQETGSRAERRRRNGRRRRGRRSSRRQGSVTREQRSGDTEMVTLNLPLRDPGIL